MQPVCCQRPPRNPAPAARTHARWPSAGSACSSACSPAAERPLKLPLRPRGRQEDCRAHTASPGRCGTVSAMLGPPANSPRSRGVRQTVGPGRLLSAEPRPASETPRVLPTETLASPRPTAPEWSFRAVLTGPTTRRPAADSKTGSSLRGDRIPIPVVRTTPSPTASFHLVHGSPRRQGIRDAFSKTASENV